MCVCACVCLCACSDHLTTFVCLPIKMLFPLGLIRTYSSGMIFIVCVRGGEGERERERHPLSLSLTYTHAQVHYILKYACVHYCLPAKTHILTHHHHNHKYHHHHHHHLTSKHPLVYTHRHIYQQHTHPLECTQRHSNTTPTV